MKAKDVREKKIIYPKKDKIPKKCKSCKYNYIKYDKHSMNVISFACVKWPECNYKKTTKFFKNVKRN